MTYNDFLGIGGSEPVVKEPVKRATSPDGLTYVDDGSPTPLYFQRQLAMQGALTPAQKANSMAYDAAVTFSPPAGDNRYQLDNKTGTYFTEARNGRRTYVTNDPAAQQRSMEKPLFTVQNGVGSSDNPNLAPLSAGSGAVAGRQGTPAEAARGNAYYAASGSSDPAKSGGAGASWTDMGAHAAQAQSQFQDLSRTRGAEAQDMYAQGQAAQGRDAAQTYGVDYGGPQTVKSTAAKTVDYGDPQQIAKTQQATTGNFGTQQSVSAPTLAAAKQAAMGNFGAQQTVSAANVGPAAQAAAQQASATQAQNQAGFLAGTAQTARNIADLDFSQANQSRGDVQQSLSDVRGFLQAGPGPSMAQQQLRQAQESNLGDALSLARSGRGNAAGNMKMALSENAATNAQTNMQAAQLRAQEADTWQQRQLQGLGLQSSTASNLRQQDLGAAQAQGQQAISREQIASNVDVNRASLENALSQFNAGAQNQASLTNAQLGTQTNLQNAEQSNIGTRLQAQLSTDANVQQAALANARNIAQGQAGTQTNISNAEQSNLTSRLQGQLSSDAAIQQAALANARNVAIGQAGTQTSISNAQTAADRVKAQAELANQLAIAQGNSSTQIGTTNATNATQANMTQGELANALAIAQGNSSTNINTANLDAQVKQNQLNDELQSALTGYGVDLSGQQINATNYGTSNQFDYDQLAADIDARNLDRAAGISTANKDRKQKQDSALIGALAAGFESIV